MTQEERRARLLRALLDENRLYAEMEVPETADKQKELLRGLMNVRIAAPIDEEVLQLQDAYLQECNAQRGIVTLHDLTPVDENLYLWQGDITRLQVGAIVNAANSGMTGCYKPNHACIDNCIHTYAGMQLRLKCYEMMQAQGHEEPVGQAKITPAYNLPCDYILHTVGPTVWGPLTDDHRQQLEHCYTSCLRLAVENGVESVAFCCISTGVFAFPRRAAAEIAVRTVRAFQKQHPITVVFCVFSEEDSALYRNLLANDL